MTCSIFDRRNTQQYNLIHAIPSQTLVHSDIPVGGVGYLLHPYEERAGNLQLGQVAALRISVSFIGTLPFLFLLDGTSKENN